MDASLLSVPNATATNDLAIRSDPFPNVIDGSPTVLDHIEIAPILRAISFPQWPGELEGGLAAYRQ